MKKKRTIKNDDEVVVKSNRREDYFRCKVCKRLWADSECVVDPIKGNICPNGCVKPFIQPEYELPTQE